MLSAIIRGADKKIKHHIISDKIEMGQASNKHVFVKADDTLKAGKPSFQVGQTYWITDGFFCF